MRKRIIRFLTSPCIALAALYSSITFPVAAQVNEQDSLALVALYNATNGEAWNDNSNWLQGNVSTWYGVDVEEGRVDTLALSNNGLTGTIPAEIGMLTSLKSLMLENQGLSGTLPSTLGDLKELRHFVVSGSNIEGEIPEQLGTLQHLATLYISDTKLSGPIPTEISQLQNLEFILLVANTNLKGPMPMEILALPKLRLFVSINTSLEGSQMPTFISSAVNLEQITIINSGFTGSIPAQLASLNKLKTVNLDNNNFSELSDLTSMPALTSLTVSNNRLTYEDIERNLELLDQGKTFSYIPQQRVYEAQSISARAGSRLIIKGEIGGSANNYRWFKDGQPSETTPNLTFEKISTEDAGVYDLEIGSAVVTNLTLHRNPVQLFVEPETTYVSCESPTILLDVSVPDPAATYQWSNGTTTPTLVVNTSGKYGVRIETAGYVLMDTLQVTIPVQLSLGPDIDTCAPSVSLTSSVTGGDQYAWKTPHGPDNGSGTVIADVNGQYILEVTTKICTQKDTVNVILNRFTEGNYQIRAGSAVVADENLIALSNVELAFFNITEGGKDFTWSFGDGSSTTEEMPEHAYTKSGEYIITLSGTDNRNCPITVTKNILVEDLFISNAITLNGDGKNDKLYVEPFLYSAELRVINRWGMEVYQESSYNNDFTGNNLDSGVYYYELYFKEIDRRFKGYVHILK